jgi:hypothetical protein
MEEQLPISVLDLAETENRESEEPRNRDSHGENVRTVPARNPEARHEFPVICLGRRRLLSNRANLARVDPERPDEAPVDWRDSSARGR